MTAPEFLLTVPTNLPTHLEKAPLIEAIFEFRFETTQESFAELLPGVLFTKLGHKYARYETTPLSGIPKEIKEKNPDLKYQAQYRLIDNEGGILSVGDRVASVSVGPQYEGWEKFRPRINEFVDIVEKTGLVKKVDRFSLKSINVFEASKEKQLKLLNLDIEIGGIKARESGFKLRTEINDDIYYRIIEVATNVDAQLRTGEKKSGLLLSLDCVRSIKGEDYWSIRHEILNQLHFEIKKLFFGIITKETLSTLGPIY